MEKATSVNSIAEEKFVEIFCDTFGPDKANNLYSYNLSKNKEANKLDKNVVAIVDYNDDYVLYISDNITPPLRMFPNKNCKS